MTSKKPEIDFDTPEGRAEYEKRMKKLKPLMDKLDKLQDDESFVEEGGPMTTPRQIDLRREHKIDEKGKKDE